MGKVFEIKVAKNRLKAELVLKQGEEVSAISVDDLAGLMAEQKITYGIKSEVLEQIAQGPESIAFPIVVAEGRAPDNGKDGYLRNEIVENHETGADKFNFRIVMKIPSVKKGQLLASVIPATSGAPGKDIAGKPIAPKPGRPQQVRPGKNVILEEGRFYATSDGQVCITQKSVSVNPVFEVKGDLDLRTGNIDFVGNIIIHGNVPSGYELKAGGDIRIHGMVEAANLQAEGNIIVDGGIAGAMRGMVIAGGNVQANYLNQASVKTSHDIYIKTSILHSRVHAGGNVDCKGAKIIGGMTTAGRNIYASDIGNELFTKTELAVGWDAGLEKVEQETFDAFHAVEGNIAKLSAIESKLSELEKQAGKLTVEQQQMLENQRATRLDLERKANELQDQLKLIQIEKQERQNSYLLVSGQVYPNVKVYFGKYAYMTNQTFRNVVFRLDHNEVRINPAEDAEKIH